MDPSSPLEISRVCPERTKLIWSKSISVCESKLLGHCPVLNALLTTVYYASKTRYQTTGRFMAYPKLKDRKRRAL